MIAELRLAKEYCSLKYNLGIDILYIDIVVISFPTEKEQDDPSTHEMCIELIDESRSRGQRSYLKMVLLNQVFIPHDLIPYE